MPQQYRHLAYTYLLEQFVLPVYATTLEPLVWQKTAQAYQQQIQEGLLCSSDTLLWVLIDETCQQQILLIDEAHKKNRTLAFLAQFSPEQVRDIVDIYYWKSKQYELLLKRYDHQIHHLIGRFTQQYLHLKSYQDDIYQETTLLLWEQLSLKKIRHFEGTSLFGTFFYAIIRRAIIKAVKRLKPAEQNTLDIWAVSNDDGEETQIDLADNQADEVYASILPQHLQTIHHFTLSLTPNDRNKLLFCWQLVYNVYFSAPPEVHQYYPNCSNDLFLDILIIQQQKNTKEQIFEQLTVLIKQLAYNEISKDALKKWLNRKRQTVYTLLFAMYLLEKKITEINAYWDLLIQRFFANKAERLKISQVNR